MLILLAKYGHPSNINEKCYDNLIIGAATSYNIDKLFSFVTSYKYSGTILNARLIILLHNNQRNDKELLYFLKRYNVDIEFVIPDQHIGNFRFKWIRKYLRNSSNRYCNVLITDVRGMIIITIIFSIIIIIIITVIIIIRCIFSKKFLQ